LEINHQLAGGSADADSLDVQLLLLQGMAEYFTHDLGYSISKRWLKNF